VTHNGFGDRAVTPIDLVHWPHPAAGHGRRDPSGVAFSRSGAVAIVAATGSRTVTLLDAAAAAQAHVKHAGRGPVRRPSRAAPRSSPTAPPTAEGDPIGGPMSATRRQLLRAGAATAVGAATIGRATAEGAAGPRASPTS